MSKTACPLDCYDACSIIYEDGKLKGDPSHSLTQGFLCPHLNHYEKHERISQPRYKGETISMKEALSLLEQKLKEIPNNRTLHLRGHGNFGLMQGVTDHFFASHGAQLTKGSLCDGAGEAGILKGRGSNLLLTPEQIAKSEVVIFWGRNPHVTNSHYLPMLKAKSVIVIDPVRTKMADQADFFVQIKPHGDLYLALLLCRFIMSEGMEDEAYLKEFAPEYEGFYELTQTIDTEAILDKVDLSLGDIRKILALIRAKRTVILAGIGIQKYRNGAEVMRSIDAIGVLLGAFGKEGSGVNFLGSSTEGVVSPFNQNAKRVAVGNIDFSDFDMLFIQGMNPLSQLPDTNRVEHEMHGLQEVVYFGLYENESSLRADLVIPAKSFLEKDDIRSSYGDNDLLKMPKQLESDIGISEYELTQYLCKAFDIDLKSEAQYLEHFESHRYHVRSRQDPPYQEGFDTDDGKFVFLDEIDSDFDLEKELFLLTCKSPKSLNSQFHREQYVYVNPTMGYLEQQRIRLVSDSGSVELDVKCNDAVRHDCVLIYSGTPGVNRLTSSKLSYEGDNAAYQENKVKVEVC
ncbi:MAG: molybdopterin-dependent oxidoreductase [Campylobacterota bacterium]|nr:molybdopterin-dependent oxidoreductase [Campylobacterota bacterium]